MPYLIQFIILFFLGLAAPLSFADSTALVVGRSSAMQQTSEPDTTSNQCYVLNSKTIYAHGRMLPEKTDETTASSPSCAPGYGPVSAYGSVAGGKTYLVVAGKESTYALHTTGTSFGVKCCPIKKVWKPIPKPSTPSHRAN